MLQRFRSFLRLAIGLSGVIILACAGSSNDPDAHPDSGAAGASQCQPQTDSVQKTVFLPNCAIAGCHGGSDPAGSLDLTSSGIEARLVGLAATECGGQTLVVAGNPDKSYLVNKLAEAKPACGTRMPSSVTALSQGDLQCVRSWIASLKAPIGAPDGSVVDSGPACLPGLSACPSGCVDTSTDPKNCGTCGNMCTGACSNGKCVALCPAPTTACGGACVDMSTSSSHCGSCAHACPTGKTCVSGACSCGPTVSFASQLQPILIASCTGNGCHAGVMPKANLLLTSGKAYASLVNAPSSACAAKIEVVPGSVERSYLMNKLTGVGMCAGTLMPKAGSPLPTNQVDLFRAWICNGAPNN